MYFLGSLRAWFVAQMGGFDQAEAIHDIRRARIARDRARCCAAIVEAKGKRDLDSVHASRELVRDRKKSARKMERGHSEIVTR